MFSKNILSPLKAAVTNMKLSPFRLETQLFHRSKTIRKYTLCLVIVYFWELHNKSITLIYGTEHLVLFFHKEFECQNAKHKCFPWCSHHSSLNCLSRAILILYFHSVCINEVAQGKRKQINQKQSHYTILKSFFRTQFNYDANRLPSS